MTPISLSQIPLFKSTPTQFQTVIFASTNTFYVGDNDGELSETHEGKDNDGIWVTKTILSSHAHAHRVFQKYQCLSVYSLIISMLHLQSELVKCHHSVVCSNVISAGLSPCQLELVACHNMAHTHDVAVVDADVMILHLHPLHNLRCRKSQSLFILRWTMEHFEEDVVHAVNL